MLLIDKKCLVAEFLMQTLLSLPLFAKKRCSCSYIQQPLPWPDPSTNGFWRGLVRPYITFLGNVLAYMPYSYIQSGLLHHPLLLTTARTIPGFSSPFCVCELCFHYCCISAWYLSVFPPVSSLLPHDVLHLCQIVKLLSLVTCCKSPMCFCQFVSFPSVQVSPCTTCLLDPDHAYVYISTCSINLDLYLYVYAFWEPVLSQGLIRHMTNLTLQLIELYLQNILGSIYRCNAIACFI